MLETEIKILDINKAEVEAKLLSIGAEKVFEGEIIAIYYDLPDRSIGSKKNVFRLRKEADRAILTFKQHIDDHLAKVREETEVEVSDFFSMKHILESLGFSPWLKMRKHRTGFRLGSVHFEIDKYHDEFEYIPVFLEIEGADKSTVYEYAELLGFSREDCRPWDAVQVARYYFRE